MHQDVEDVRMWVLGRGADAARIAIVGASWGGYLALGGATAVADAAVSPPSAATAAPRYAAVVAVVPLTCVGAANRSAAFRGDPLVRRYWGQLYGAEVTGARRGWHSAAVVSAAAPITFPLLPPHPLPHHLYWLPPPSRAL